MSTRKEFSSLRKHRHTGVQPRNLLGDPVLKIGIPTENTINQGAIYVVNPADLSQKTRSQDVKTCFFVPTAIIDSGLHEEPKVSIDVATVEYNGTKIVSTGERDLMLNVAKNGNFLYFLRSKAYVDKMVIPKGAIRHIVFSKDDRNVLFVLQKKFGIIYVNFAEKALELRLFLQADLSSWIEGKFLIEELAQVQELHQQRLSKREISNKDPQFVIKPSASPETCEIVDDSDDVLRNGIPSKLNDKIFLGRKTRATTRMLEEDPELYAFYAERSIDYEEDEDLMDEDVPIIQETPASFDPPLKYTLTNGKKFIISYNDFKTLYNNDWINDTLIDFFIAYEIDRAANELQLIREDEVFAFNSFFFTKLMSKSEEQDTPDYYGNIRRWLTKIDLMSYDSVIIPINEHLHWFCCVIKNLPALLKEATRYRDENLPVYDDETGKPLKLEPVAEFFVFDSLRQSHPNISQPIKKIINEYCKDKYGVSIPPQLIKAQPARVPKQRNFNDCGIHVIYNVRKWLSEPEVCEKVWRKFAKSQRTYFSGTERNSLRRTCIDLLLELHLQQPAEESASSMEGGDENLSEDEIEVISYHSSLPVDVEGTQTEGENANGMEKSLSTMSDIKPTLDEVSKDSRANLPEKSTASTSKGDRDSVPTTPIRTLDPRVLKAASKGSDMKVINPTTSITNTFGTTENRLGTRRSIQIGHEQIRRLCKPHYLKQHSIDFLNEYFVDHSKKYTESQLAAIIEFIKKYNFFNPAVEEKQCELLKKELIVELQEPPAPIDEPFSIQEADDSSGELNQSVSDLRISNDDLSSLTGSQTPEATRKFMKEADNISPLRRSHRSGLITKVQQRNTRSKQPLKQVDSDLEELGDDDVHILPDGELKVQNNSSSNSKSKNQPGVSPNTRSKVAKEAVIDDDAVTEVVAPKPTDGVEIVSDSEEEIAIRKPRSVGKNPKSTSAVRILLTGPKRRRVDTHGDEVVVVRRAHS